METVYFNGSFAPKDQVRISPDDRGFLLADGVYEVTPAYHGQFLRLADHLERFERGLAALRIGVEMEPLTGIAGELLALNGLTGADGAYVYLQATRGAAPRGHAFPSPATTPTLYGFARRIEWWDAERRERGSRAILVPDLRWARADIKSIGLLPNVLAQQAAVEAGADDAILVHDGIAREGGHSNLFAVIRGTLVTHPCTAAILPGITRSIVLELAATLKIPSVEREITVDELANADEVFLTGTTTEVRPVVEIDGRRVASGRPGEITRALHDEYRTLARPPVLAPPVDPGA